MDGLPPTPTVTTSYDMGSSRAGASGPNLVFSQNESERGSPVQFQMSPWDKGYKLGHSSRQMWASTPALATAASGVGATAPSATILGPGSTSIVAGNDETPSHNLTARGAFQNSVASRWDVQGSQTSLGAPSSQGFGRKSSVPGISSQLDYTQIPPSTGVGSSHSSHSSHEAAASKRPTAEEAKLSQSLEVKERVIAQLKLENEVLVTSMTLSKHVESPSDASEISHRILSRLRTLREENERLAASTSHKRIVELELQIDNFKRENEALKRGKA